METLILRPKTKEQAKAIKAVAKVLKVELETEESPYDPGFVKDILQAREEFKNGKTVKIALEDLWK